MAKHRRDQGQGSLYRRGRRWCIQYYADGRRVIESTGQTDRTEAQKLLNQRLAAVANGQPTQVRQVRIGELWEHRLKYAKGRTVVDCTVRWRKLKPFFANILAHRLTPQHVMQYRALRAQQGVAVATVNREIEALRRAFRLAQQDGLVATVPHFHIERENNTRTGFVPDAKLDELRQAAARELWLRTFVEIGAMYGWRRGEMLGLTVAQVDFAANLIRLEVGTTKNKDAREVPMTTTVRVLLQQCCHGKKPADFVLTRGKPPRPVVDPRVAWCKLCVAVGLGRWQCQTPDCGQEQAKRGRCPQCKQRAWLYRGLLVHDLRRTAARALRNAGVPEATAMSILGHRTPSCFRRYGIINNDDKVQALVLLQAAHDRVSCKVTAISTESEVASAPAASDKVQ